MIRIVIMWILTTGGASLVAAQDLSLWYGKPAVNWHEAVPLGNGRLGGMFFRCTTNKRVKAPKGRGLSAYSTTNPFGGSSRWGVHRAHSAWLMQHLWEH